jgi:hypothetical protein
MLRTLGIIAQYLYLIRIPLFFAAATLVLAVLAFVGPSTVRNVMVTSGWLDLAVTSFLAVFSVALCVFTGTTIWNLASKRFRVPAFGGTRSRTAFRALPFLVCALPLLIALYVRSSSEARLERVTGILLGAAVTFVVLWVVERVRRWLVRLLAEPVGPPAHARGPLTQPFHRLGNALTRLTRWLGNGYYDPEFENGVRGRVEPGHALATVATLVLAVVYFAGYWAFDPGRSLLESPSIAFVLLLLMPLQVVLAGVTFYLDRYRVPVFLAVVAYVAAVFTIWRLDHYFPLQESPAMQAVPLADAVNARAAMQQAHDPGTKPILTVVAASGGGIQAAAWTARVLTGLQAEEGLGAGFARSIHLVSSASGGSVGALYFLEAIDSTLGAPLYQTLDDINRAAQASSLEATAWGWVYPDFFRLILPWGVNAFKDRAWAMERAWERSLLRLETGVRNTVTPGRASSLSDWASGVRRGVLPATIFNATVVESGRRLLVTPLDLGSISRGRGDLADRGVAALYGLSHFDLPMLTAARLSATFPYVTPIATARRTSGEPLPAWHVADGGYFDNFGVVTAAEWLVTLLEHEDRLWERFRRIVVVEIRAFPADETVEPPHRSGGWAYATWGPVRTVLKVRKSTQSVRGDFELEILSDRCPGFLESVVLAPDGIDPPLSWHLSEADKVAIDRAWEREREGAEVKRLKQLFQDPSDSSASCRVIDQTR